MRQLGYAPVSTSNQDAQLQLNALLSVGVQKRDVFADVTSGSKTAIERPGMKRLFEYAEEGDTVVVWRVDRLGRSLIDVLNTVNLLRERGAQVRSISDGIDPATSTGRLMLNMLATYGLIQIVITDHWDIRGRTWLIVWFLIMSLMSMPDSDGQTPQFGVGAAIIVAVFFLWMLAIIVPSIALTVRRLHDSNKSGWWYFISVIPFAGAIILLVFVLLPPDPAGQQYDQPTSS
ncbi:recombinase family protein [Arthrobacter sp. D3-16]